MKKPNWGALTLALIMLSSLTACSGKAVPNDTTTPENTASHSDMQIYLYGESHGEEAILEKELEIWNDYYHNDGMRHLFIELSYYGAEFLNIWMKSDNDDIIDALFNDAAGTQGDVPAAKDFYKQVKSDCPETIFHGIDVEHQWTTTGKRFLEHLEQNGLKDTEQYMLAQEGAEQGQKFHADNNWIYRENTMTENFIREFDSLDGEHIMGIYGSKHTNLNGLDPSDTVPCMANQLKKHYGDTIYSEDLSWIALDTEPSRVDTIEVNGKSYEASYFGQSNLGNRDGCAYREDWRLENAYDDFKTYPKTDGSVIRLYHRSDGTELDGEPVTTGFTVD